LVLPLSIAENLSLAALPRISPGGWLRPAEEARRGQAAASQLRIKFASLDQPVATLSGGNQQKVMLAKWLETEPRVLLLEDPTRGIDLGAKREIHRLIREWTAAGLAVLLISSELPELLGLSDRVIVLHRGAVTAELAGSQATPERVLAAAMGSLSSAAA
jgi:ABC-type sugar transport system ATPase subunit